MNEEPVEYAYEDQAFDNSENLAGKMTTPRNHFYLCYASCSLYCHAPLPITCYIMSPILPCQPLTTLSQQTVVWLSYRFAQPLLQRCQLQVKLKISPCWNMDMLGYHNISYLINASIYLVKGGRLGLMPGVLFHSCRPSFCHIGIMFPDFAFLTRLGDLCDPLDSSL